MHNQRTKEITKKGHYDQQRKVWAHARKVGLKGFSDLYFSSAAFKLLSSHIVAIVVPIVIIVIIVAFIVSYCKRLRDQNLTEKKLENQTRLRKERMTVENEVPASLKEVSKLHKVSY